MSDFEDFVKERIYLRNISPRTADFYRDSWNSFKRYGGELTKLGLAKYVVAMREAGVKPVSCNTFISGINAYLRWLHENERLPELLKIQKLKTEQTVIKILPDATLKALLSFRPSTFGERRLHTLLCLAMDTGIRIDEALTLSRSKIDFDNLVLTVNGKGNKERIIPFSIELRKVLYKYLKGQRHDLVFCTLHGSKVSYHN
jgi:integrase/recombinase XerD